MFLKIVISLIIGFLLGCIPGTVIAGKIAGRKLESTVTVTGVLRELGVKYALIALGIDVLKGFLAALFATLIIGGDSGLGIAIGGIAVMLGHTFNVALGFRGSRGIAPYGGVLIMSCWWLGLLMLVLGVLIFAGIKLYKPLVIITCLLAAIFVSVFVKAGWSIAYAWVMFGYALVLERSVLTGIFASRNGGFGSSGTGRRLR